MCESPQKGTRVASVTLRLSKCDLVGRHEPCFKSGVTLERVDCCQTLTTSITSDCALFGRNPERLSETRAEITSAMPTSQDKSGIAFSFGFGRKGFAERAAEFGKTEQCYLPSP